MHQSKYHDIDVWFNYGLDINARVIFIGSVSMDGEGGEGGVDYLLAEYTIKSLRMLDNVQDKPINIIMSNPGGDVVEGLAIYDAIKECKNEVIIKCYGKVWSMAGYILQAADKRIMSKNCSLMLHEGTVGYSNIHPRIVDAWRKFDKKNDVVLFNIYLERLREKDKKFKASKLTEWLKFDTIFSAEETVNIGLADEVE